VLCRELNLFSQEMVAIDGSKLGERVSTSPSSPSRSVCGR
jgi:hypothetical protein